MEPITLNRNSWHYWLATKLGAYDHWTSYNNNLCAYLPRVFMGGLCFLFTLAGSIFIIVVDGLGLAYFASGIVNGVWFRMEDNEPFLMVGTILFILTFAVGLAFGFYQVYPKMREALEKYCPHTSPTPTVEKEPGFITLAYRSFKDKVCYPIKFEDK